jgi:hypothetical protein
VDTNAHAKTLTFFGPKVGGPEGLDVHIVMDNYATHKTPEIKTWLAHARRRFSKAR